MVTLTKRLVKGSALTYAEGDANLDALNNGKQDTLVSGSNIKTINGSDITGAGNLVISGGGGGSYADGDYGDIIASGSGTGLNLDPSVVTAAARTVLNQSTVSAMVDTLGGASASGTGGIARTAGPVLSNATLNGSTTFGGAVTLNQDGSAAFHPVTYQQLQAAQVSVGKRTRCRVATTANITIATALVTGQILNGVTLAAGDKVLVKDQSTGAQNGIYIVSASPARDTEFDTWAEFPGSVIGVYEGSTNPDTVWFCTNNDGGTLNTTAIVFTQFTVSGALTPANNLSDVSSVATARTNLGALASAGPSSTGLVTEAGPSSLTSVTIAITTNAGTVDVTKAYGVASNNANTTLSFSGTPAADTIFAFECVNSDASNAHTWTVPSGFSVAQQGTITTFVLPASGRAIIVARHNGTIYQYEGDPQGDRDAAEETIASAATTAIGGTLSKNVSITGTTTITGLGTIAAGVYRRCRCTGALPITAGAAVLIPGVVSGQTVTLAAGDRFDALSLGSGNWVLHNFMRVIGQRLNNTPAAITTSRALAASDFNDAGAPYLIRVDTAGGAVVLTLNSSTVLPGQRAFFQRNGANGLTIVTGTATVNNPDSLTVADKGIIGVVGDTITSGNAVLV